MASATGATQPVLSRLKTLSLKLDLTAVLDGQKRNCKRLRGCGEHDLGSLGLGLRLILDMCNNLQDLKIMANRVLLGTERVDRSY